MPKQLLVIGLLFCGTAYAATNTTAVGTATVRGEMLIDGNHVTSDATLFDGSIAETTEASATLNMFTHAAVVMAANTRGITHDGYVMLEHGKIDVKPTCGFVVEANGVRITPNSPTSHAVIYISNSSASVQSVDGEFLVLDDQGRVQSTIHSGQSQSFGAGQASRLGQNAPAVYAGSLNSLDSHPILTLFGPDSKVSYELQGRKADKIDGKLALVDGTVNPKRTSFYTEEVISEKKETAMCTTRVTAYPWLMAGAAAAGAAVAAAIVITNNPPPSASR